MLLQGHLRKIDFKNPNFIGHAAFKFQAAVPPPKVDLQCHIKVPLPKEISCQASFQGHLPKIDFKNPNFISHAAFKFQDAVSAPNADLHGARCNAP